MGSKTRVMAILVVLSILIGGLSTHPLLVKSSTTGFNLHPFNPQIDDQVQEIMEEVYIPSVTTTVVRNNSIIWAKWYG